MLRQVGSFEREYQAGELYLTEIHRAIIKRQRYTPLGELFCQRALLYAQIFSKVIKQACGRTPSDLINETAMEQIKYRLKHSDKSIKEIAEEFNFPNQSFFGKYVKAHLGTSPANYRNRKEE